MKVYQEHTHELSLLYFNELKLPDAEQRCRQELELAQQLFGRYSIRSAIAANNLAQINQQQGNNTQAEKYFRLALETCEHCGGGETGIQRINILNNFAIFYERNGYYADSRLLVTNALKLQKKARVYVEGRVKSLLVQATIDKDLFDFEQAEQSYEEALELIKSSSNRRLFCEALDHYADLLLAQRRFSEAKPV
jgi:tetratricopeptide (TPR) repeat protein